MIYLLEVFPPEVINLLKQYLPPNQTIWWVRGLVLDVQIVERPTEKPLKQNPGGRLRDMLLKIGDLDTPDDGYDVRIEGIHHEVEINDVVTLLGHELKDAKQVSYPRVFLNHNTGHFARAYPEASRLQYGAVPIVEYKYWLSAKTPASVSGKIANFLVLFAMVVLVPFLYIYSTAGLIYSLLFLAVFLVFVLPIMITGFVVYGYMRWLTAQPRFSYEKKAPPHLFFKNIQEYLGYSRVDLTKLYEGIVYELYNWAPKNPDPAIEFVVVPRGSHTNGKLQ